MKYLVTGGAGFIGSAFVRKLVLDEGVQVLNIDKLTYAGNLASLKSVENKPNYRFEKVDICDGISVEKIFTEFQPDRVVHLAAESHVDRSISNASDFISTNIVGTYTLLEVSRKYWQSTSPEVRERFRFHHVSTDEVYGDLSDIDQKGFSEKTSYAPSSPYSASKAGSDHFVRAWGRTFGLPIVVTNCSNNYGPYQFPEKLIPLTILNALSGKDIPVYGDGKQVRDWIFVEDHVDAMYEVVQKGRVGETYNIGGNSERKNIDVVRAICEILDQIRPEYVKRSGPHEKYITYVKDRLGHDVHYAVDNTKITSELGWRPKESFESGIQKTIHWYIENDEWLSHISQSKN